MRTKGDTVTNYSEKAKEANRVFRLPTCTIGKTVYFVDLKLGEYRNRDNPADSISMDDMIDRLSFVGWDGNGAVFSVYENAEQDFKP